MACSRSTRTLNEPVGVTRAAKLRAATLHTGTADSVCNAATRNGRVGVIGTVATVTSGAYTDAFAAAPDVAVTSVACPQFVDFVERGVTSGRALLGLAQSYLEPLQRADVDTLVLGCTHYPMLAGMIGLVMGDQVTLVSSADETAREVYRVLTERDLLRTETTSKDPVGPADPVTHTFLATGDPEPFARLAERFLGRRVPVAVAASAGVDAAPVGAAR